MNIAPMTFSKETQSWIAAGLFFLLAFLVLFDPLPEPWLTIAQAAIFFPTAIWGYFISRKKDEVMVHASRTAFSTGAKVGLVLSGLGVVAMRFIPAVTEFVVRAAESASDTLPAPAAGFGMGVVFTFVMIGVSVMPAYAIWWTRSR